MERDELRLKMLDLVENIVGGGQSEEDEDLLLEELLRISPDPHISNYIFWSDQAMSIQDIVDRALNYKPLEL